MTSSELHHSGATERAIWILRSDAHQRAALVRLSGLAGAHVHTGSPGDARFRAARGDAKAAHVALVVLGVSGDPELELEYVHRNAPHLVQAEWIIVSDDRSDAELAALFDALGATFIGPPVQGVRLRGAIGRALRAPDARDSLRLRRYRDALSERFARWFADLDLPELLRAMDPQLARVPIVLRGAPGTGRALLARYVHTFGGDAAGGQMPFVEILCSADTSRADLLRAIETSAGARHATLFLKDLEELGPQPEVELRNWIEFGLPPGTRCASQVRWVAALAPDGSRAMHACARLDPDLLAVLSGLEVRLPPLRARRDAIEAFARATALAHSESTGRRARGFSADAISALRSYDWPGNLRQLESVLQRAFADSGADPLEPQHLRIPAPQPIEVEQLAETWHTEVDPEESLPEAEILDPHDAGVEVDKGGDTASHSAANATGREAGVGARPTLSRRAPAIELLTSDLLSGSDVESHSGERVEGVLVDDETIDEERSDEGEDEETSFEWLAEDTHEDEDDEGADDWIEGEPIDENASPDAIGDTAADDLEALPWIEVRPLQQGEPAAGAATRTGTGTGTGTDVGQAAPAAAAHAPREHGEHGERSEREAESQAWQRALAAICDELQRPVEAIRSLSVALALNHIAPDFADGFASEIAHNIDRAQQTSQQLAAIQPSLDTSSDVSQLLESLLAELRGEISRRGLLVLKELDRARPQVLAPPSALRFALRSLLARFVALAHDTASSDLYVASHYNPSGLRGQPSMRILIRHARTPGAHRAAPEAPIDGAGRNLGIELALCNAVARAAGGALDLSEPGDGQLVVIIDLPAPA